MTLTHSNSGTVGSSSNATCYYISPTLALIIGTASVTANTSTNSNKCSLQITGGTIVNATINAYVGADTDSYLMYAGGVGDFYIHSSNTGSRTFYARIMGIIAI